MEKSEHKKISRCDENVLVGAVFQRKEYQYAVNLPITNTEKNNQKLTGNMYVEQKEGENLTIKFFVLTDLQYIKWQQDVAHLTPPAFVRMDKESFLDPQEYLYSSKIAVPSCNFEIPINDETSIYFVLENRFSYIHSKNVKLTIFEEWDEIVLPDEASRKKYINAKESLAKAIECLNEKVEDVTIHLRITIDLAIKERFNFSKIYRMKNFLKDADKYNFPLPSYNLIYGLFDEGSSRIHAGKGNTLFEAKQMVRIVTDFIDALKTIKITNEKINDFKSKCDVVE